MPASKRPTTAELPCDGPIDRYGFAQAALSGILSRRSTIYPVALKVLEEVVQEAWNVADAMTEEGLRRDRARAEQLQSNPQDQEE